MPGQQAPLGQLSTIMVAKESTFGSFSTTNPIFHAYRTHGPSVTTATIDRAPRGSLAKPYPGTGGRTVAMSLDVEADEDTFPQLLAYTLGAQTNPTTALFSSTLASSVITGATTCTLASTNFLFAGQSLVIDVGGANPETVTVLSISGLNAVKFTPALAHNHTNGVTCSVTGAVAKASVMTMGSPLPSFSMQVYRPGGTSTDYLGSCIDQLALSIAEGGDLKAKVSLRAQQAVKDASPLNPFTPTNLMSVLNPYIFAQQNTFAQIGGEVTGLPSSATLKTWQLSIANNLKENWSYGAGNLVRNFQEMQRAVTGTFTLLFDSDAQRANFDAALSGGNLPAITCLIPLVGTDMAGNSSPFGIGIYLPNVFLSKFTLADDTTKPCEQTVAFSAAESLPGANDPISATVVAKGSTVY